MKNRLKSILILILCFAFLIPSAKVEAGTSVKQQAQAPVKNFYKYAKTLNGSITKLVGFRVPDIVPPAHVK